MNVRRRWGCPFCMRRARLISLMGLGVLLVNKAFFSTVPYDECIDVIVIAIVVASSSLWIIHTFVYSNNIVSRANRKERAQNSITKEHALSRRDFAVDLLRTAFAVAVSTGLSTIGAKTANANPNDTVCCCDTGACLYDCSTTTRADCHQIGGQECPMSKC